MSEELVPSSRRSRRTDLRPCTPTSAYVVYWAKSCKHKDSLIRAFLRIPLPHVVSLGANRPTRKLAPLFEPQANRRNRFFFRLFILRRWVFLMLLDSSKPCLFLFGLSFRTSSFRIQNRLFGNWLIYCTPTSSYWRTRRSSSCPLIKENSSFCDIYLRASILVTWHFWAIGTKSSA